MSIFKPVARDINFPASEEKWISYWKENDIFAKQLAAGKERAVAEGKRTFVFYEGPPTANGLPHPGHVLTRVVKDLFPRFRAMQGYDVPRKAGWDTHGLPVEIEVEKELGIDGKQGIEEYGVQPFIEKCRDSVFKYSDVWSRLTERIGFWIDLDNPYITYEKSYTESVWWSLKQLWDAGLLYHGAKVVPWCPRCGTALSSHEVGQGYREVEDPSLYVTFRAKGEDNLSFLAWTTTPWTLLSNVALAVNTGFEYDFVTVGEETLVMASALREKVMGKLPHEVKKTITGAELIGLEYEPLFTFADVDKPAWRIVEADFVGLDTGSGVVHMAPAFGEDDYRIAAENGLPFINLVKTDGTFVDAVTPWKGRFVKDADKDIIKHLKERKLVLKSERCKHDYPFCWRCETPLLYYGRPTWYIATSTLKEELLANNAQITWYPEHIRDGRFGNFLASNVDWALSRERYWGTPLPIWVCEECDHRIAVGSEKEMREQAFDRKALPAEIDLHKPYVDDVFLKCPECSSRMKRVTEVVDCWYDSGAMPFAQWGYPHAPGSREMLEKALPADFISEALDQTRGWFYSLLSIATLLRECGQRNEKSDELAPWVNKEWPLPYKRCLVLGLLLAEDGLKLSKSKKNYPDPDDVFASEGADAMRWFFYISNQPWTSTRFFEAGIREAQKDFLIRLRNIFSFFVIYANIDSFNPSVGNESLSDISALNDGDGYCSPGERSLLDRWMLSKLESATRAVTQNLENLNIFPAARALYDLVEMLSNWYVRRSRDRFWKSEKDEDKSSAYWTLYESLTRLSLLIAPFTPFMSEELYHGLCYDLWKGSLPESVHLCSWPAVREECIAPAVEQQMDLVREIASLGLSARAGQKLKVRQPLSRAIVVLSDTGVVEEVRDLSRVIQEEINVKELEFAENAAEYVQYSVKPDFQKLGPKLGKQVKACAGALATVDAATVVKAIHETGRYMLTLDGVELELNADELDIRISAQDGFAAADGNGAVVILDTTITEELEREGLARELVNRIQNMRRELDLAYESRINVRIGTGGMVARAAVEFRESLAGEILAGELVIEFEDLGFTREFEIAGEAVRISIREC